MSPGPDSPPGPEPSPGSSPPPPGGEPGPNPPSGPQSDGPEAPTDEAPRRSRSARRRARRRAARRAREQDGPTAGTGQSGPPEADAEAPGAAPEASPRPGRGAPRATSHTGRQGSNRTQSPNRSQGANRNQGGRGPKRLDSPPDPETRGRARRGRLRQVEEFSAGGLVLDLNGEVPRGALIGRTDRQGRLLWSLPKGHIEAGETAEQAAVREVEEETGIAGTILGELGTIDFWFVADGRRIHKTVRHYLMRRVAGELSDADVEVDEVAWVPFSEIRGQLAYPDERGLVDTAGRMLADSA